MIKKTIVLLLILTFSISCFCSCTVYKYNPMPSEFEASKIIGHTQEEIIALYGEPYIVLERTHYVDDVAVDTTAILYKTGVLSMFLDSYTEYLYIGFNEETGVADTIIHPWTDDDIR